MSLDQTNPENINPRSEAREQVELGFHDELEGLGLDVEALQSNKMFLERYDYFGLPAETQNQQDQLLALLNSFDIDVSTVPSSIIKATLRREMSEIEVANSEKNFKTLFDQLKTKQITNADYLKQVLVLAEEDKQAVPPEYVAQYQQFQKLLSPALVTNPSDRQIIESRFAILDLATNPEPFAFIQDEVLANDQISEDTKDRVREAFDLSKLEIDSGTDIAKGLTQQIVNPETGELEYQFDETRKLEFRKGLKAFNQSQTGNKMITAELDDGRTRDFDVTGWPASTLTEFSDYLMLWRVTEQAGISNLLEGVFYVDMALIDDFDPQKARQSRQTIDALLGNHQGYDGRIMSESDGDFLVWMLQAFSPKGDAAQGDYNIEATNRNLVELGIKDESGQINFETLKSAGSYLRGIYLSGEPSFEVLKKHLQAVETV